MDFALLLPSPPIIETLANLDSYNARAWTYIYQHKYGSPEVDHVDANVTSARVAPDGLSVDLTVSPLTKGIFIISVLEVYGQKMGRNFGTPMPTTRSTRFPIPEQRKLV